MHIYRFCVAPPVASQARHGSCDPASKCNRDARHMRRWNLQTDHVSVETMSVWHLDTCSWQGSGGVMFHDRPSPSI
jgi:hypothetical protein